MIRVAGTMAVGQRESAVAWNRKEHVAENKVYKIVTGKHSLLNQCCHLSSCLRLLIPPGCVEISSTNADWW